MRKILVNVGIALSVLHLRHKVDVAVTSELTPDVFPKDSSQFIQATGPVYVALRGNWSTEYMQSQSTDESILPSYGGNWFDGAEPANALPQLDPR